MAYLLLSDGSVHEGDPPARGFYVAGESRGGAFLPEGDVQGDGELGGAGSPGWMELANGVFQSDRVARAPFTPYVRGYRDDDGHFVPATRTIEY